jgi:hypothetical protein
MHEELTGRWRDHHKDGARTKAARRPLTDYSDGCDSLPAPGSSWRDRPAVAIPPPPPGGRVLACAYHTKGSYVRSRAVIALFFVGVCLYVAFFYHRSVLIPAICMSCIGYYLIVLGNPARALAAGEDWLSAHPGGKGNATPWVRTTHLAELRFESRAGSVIELRDQHGRIMRVRLPDLRSNQLLYALFVRAVRESHRSGMRIDETAANVLFLDMPVLGDEISFDEEGCPKVTYFAVHLLEDGPGEPITVIRRTPGSPFPSDETLNGQGQWEPDGYLYQFLGVPEGFAFTRISERQALAFMEAIRNELDAEREGSGGSR